MDRTLNAIVLVFLLIMTIAPFAPAQTPNANILTKVYAIEVRNQRATAFTVDVDDRQYLVTAAHLFRTDSINWNGDTISVHAEVDSIGLYTDSAWLRLPVKHVHSPCDSVDVAVLALPIQLSPSLRLEPTADDLVFGQDVFFLGFPLTAMLRTPDAGLINRGFPFPFIKKAILSAQRIDENGVKIFYLDGHNNRGFSGGPAVFWNPKAEGFNVFGVVAAYISEHDRIFRVVPQADSTYRLEPIPGAVYQTNTGIVLVTDISVAVDMIRANPIGAKLSP